jgi:hypothetical protein
LPFGELLIRLPDNATCQLGDRSIALHVSGKGHGLKELLEFFAAQVTIQEDFSQKARSDNFAGMNRNYSDTTVRMLEEMMAAFDPNCFKSRTAQNDYDFLSR